MRASSGRKSIDPAVQATRYPPPNTRPKPAGIRRRPVGPPAIHRAGMDRGKGAPSGLARWTGYRPVPTTARGWAAGSPFAGRPDLRPHRPRPSGDWRPPTRRHPAHGAGLPADWAGGGISGAINGPGSSITNGLAMRCTDQDVCHSFRLLRRSNGSTANRAG